MKSELCESTAICCSNKQKNGTDDVVRRVAKNRRHCGKMTNLEQKSRTPVIVHFLINKLIEGGEFLNYGSHTLPEVRSGAVIDRPSRSLGRLIREPQTKQTRHHRAPMSMRLH